MAAILDLGPLCDELSGVKGFVSSVTIMENPAKRMMHKTSLLSYHAELTSFVDSGKIEDSFKIGHI